MFRVLSNLLCILFAITITTAYAETNSTQHSTTTKHHVAVTPKHTTTKKHTSTKHHTSTVATSHKHLSSMKQVNSNHKATHHSGAITEEIDISQLVDFGDNSAAVRDLIIKAHRLSGMHLTYLYGSADPRNHGMDCSGAIHFLLKQTTLQDVPRQSDQIFDWLERAGTIHPADDTEFNGDFKDLKPGDLLFWSGTYVTHRTSPISHVMLYIGKNKRGQRLMFGSSDGRSYQNKRIRGVSVFDFKLPTGKGKQRFVGYGCIPNLTC